MHWRLFRSPEGVEGSGNTGEISCDQACDWIDAEPRLDPERQRLLAEHLADCPECTSEREFVCCVRPIVSPGELPKPSQAFEALIWNQIKPDPLPVAESAPDPVTRWGWIGVYVTLAAFLLPNIGMLLRLFANLTKADAGRALVAPLLANQSIAFLWGFLGHGSAPQAFALSVVLGGAILLGGAAAVGTVWKK